MLITLYDRSLLKQNKSNVFVKNLSRTATNRKLYEMFAAFGEVFSSKLAQDFQGKPKGYGFVQYKTSEAAEAAVAKMNGFDFDGKKLIVEMYKVVERREARGFTNVYVKNLPESATTKETLTALFARMGKVTSVDVKKSDFKGKVGYYGFVCFSTPEEAAKAVAEMHEKTVDGAQLYVCRALTKDQREREKVRKRIEMRNQSRKYTVHVKSTNSEPLVDAQVAELQQYGEIKQIVIQKHSADGHEVNMPVGYVVFAREEDAAKVGSWLICRPPLSTPRLAPSGSICSRARNNATKNYARSTPAWLRTTALSPAPCSAASTPWACVLPTPECTIRGWEGDRGREDQDSKEGRTDTRGWICRCSRRVLHSQCSRRCTQSACLPLCSSQCLARCLSRCFQCLCRSLEVCLERALEL